MLHAGRRGNWAVHSGHIQWGLSNLFHLNRFITLLLFTKPSLCLGSSQMEREEVQALWCSPHGSRTTKAQQNWRFPELPPSGRGTGSCTDPWAQGLEAVGKVGLEEDLGERGGSLHRCREIDLGAKPARQRTAVGEIWATTGVKGNSGERG